MNEKFESCLAEAARQFQNLEKKETVRIISHLDADGITACSILLRTLQKQNRNYLVSILNQLNTNSLKDLSKESYTTYVFTDLGSGQLSLIERYLQNKKVFILDHHQPEKTETAYVHVNPHLFGFDGSKEISGAGIVYLFCKELDPTTKLAHLAVIGAIGDVQEHEGFSGLNKQIVEDAVSQGNLTVTKGLRLFGRQTKPLHKLLEYNSDFKVPGVSGSEQGSLMFLRNIGIKTIENRRWRRLIDLTDKEHERLVESVIIKRADETNPEAIIGFVYTINNEKPGTPTRDAKEFATLLNACGRMKKASLGIGVCIGDELIKKRAIKHFREYKKAIMKSMQWYRENKNKGFVEKKDNYLIINAHDNIIPTIAGTMASIISKSGEYEEGNYILSLAREKNGKTKVSLRMTGSAKVKLVDVLKHVTNKIGGEAGGHSNAAGALIDTEKEEEFIDLAKRSFREGF